MDSQIAVRDQVIEAVDSRVARIRELQCAPRNHSARKNGNAGRLEKPLVLWIKGAVDEDRLCRRALQAMSALLRDHPGGAVVRGFGSARSFPRACTGKLFFLLCRSLSGGREGSVRLRCYFDGLSDLRQAEVSARQRPLDLPQ